MSRKFTDGEGGFLVQTWTLSRFPGGSPDSVAAQRKKTLQVRLPVAPPSDS